MTLSTDRYVWYPWRWVLCVSTGLLLLLSAVAKAEAVWRAAVTDGWKTLIFAAGVPVGVAGMGVWAVKPILAQGGVAGGRHYVQCFFCVAAWRWARGDVSCGCFGSIHVHPAVTAVLDATVLVALLLIGPSPGTAVQPPWWASIAALIVGFAGVAATVAYLTARPIHVLAAATASEPGQEAWRVGGLASQTAELVGTLPADGLVVLDPPAWLGRRFPLGPHTRQLSARSDLATGEWDVLLYHWDCGACRATLAWLGGRGDGPAVVAVQAPPLAPAGEDPAGLHARIVRGHLDEGREWFVAAPVLVSVRDGVVTAVRSRDELPK